MPMCSILIYITNSQNYRQKQPVLETTIVRNTMVKIFSKGRPTLLKVFMTARYVHNVYEYGSLYGYFTKTLASLTRC